MLISIYAIIKDSDQVGPWEDHCFECSVRGHIGKVSLHN